VICEKLVFSKCSSLRIYALIPPRTLANIYVCAVMWRLQSGWHSQSGVCPAWGSGRDLPSLLYLLLALQAVRPFVIPPPTFLDSFDIRPGHETRHLETLRQKARDISRWFGKSLETFYENFSLVVSCRYLCETVLRQRDSC